MVCCLAKTDISIFAQIRKSSNLRRNNLKMPKTTKEGETDLNTSTGKYLFLFVPVTTFCLGYWQWRRHIWKTNLIEKIRSQINEEPIEFPINKFVIYRIIGIYFSLAQIEQMEYRKVHIDGTYMFQNQFIIRWRGRLDIEQNELNKSNLLSITNTSNGAQVITPFKISGTDLVIMINRGWIPPERIEFELNEGRKRQPIKKNIIGTIRGSEKPHWLLNNHPTQNIWVYKDLKQMANHCNASPILIDADNSVFNNESIEPIGNQTNIKLRNQHFNYMIQWFSLSIATLAMWISRFL